MKKPLPLILALFLFAMQTVKAQSEVDVKLHAKVTNSDITPDSSPEDVLNFIISATGKNFMLIPETSWVAFHKMSDANGNTHVGYCVDYSNQHTNYQAFLHFHSDGTLYYMNGALALLDMDAPAERPSLKTKIPAERAALVATGKTTSEVTLTIVDYKNKPHFAYKVKEPGSLQEVYVDAFSGDILYTLSNAHSLTPWSDIQGTNVKIQGNTMCSGMQYMDAMQTADGIILRDPTRNIITLNGTDKYKDAPKESLPENEIAQIVMLGSAADEIVMSEQQAKEAAYATAVRSFYLRYSPHTPDGVMPTTTSISAYYTDADENPIGEIMRIDNVTWTERSAGEYECQVVLPEPVSIDLTHDNHAFNVVIGDEEFTIPNAITAGDHILWSAIKQDDESKKLSYRFDVAVDVTQPALDVHWSIQKSYDMYDTYFDIKGSDGQGCQLINIINPSNNLPFVSCPNNAFALTVPLEDAYNNKTFYMFYGMGSMSGDMKPLVELPAIAHEFTHTITAGCGNNLVYKNESGALNEATADCMAMVTEDFATGQPSWMIGSYFVINSANLRDFKDPWYSGCINGKIVERAAQPKYYGGRYWLDYNVDPKTDNGGVHTNSGVFNYMFYLLCEGAQSITNEVGQTHTIEPIGMETMRDIVFHSMQFYNSALCNYAEIADNLMVAIEDLTSQDQSKMEALQEKLAVAYQHVGMESSVVPTGIATVAADVKSPYSGTYNLLGMPVDSSYKGVVIRNGKKFVN